MLIKASIVFLVFCVLIYTGFNVFLKSDKKKTFKWFSIVVLTSVVSIGILSTFVAIF